MTAAIVLAAGESSRFGRSKQLLRVNGKSLVRRIVEEARDAACSPVFVVAGASEEKIEHELEATNAVMITNENWKRGIGTSIRVGVQQVIDSGRDIDAIVLLVCDQPFVDAKSIRELIALHERTRQPIVASSYAQTLGVPSLFDCSCFSELLALEDDTGAKSIILSKCECVAEFPFPEGEIDIDSVEDWDQFSSRLKI
jgi:molybdenum cofactor cytidylyltransferase